LNGSPTGNGILPDSNTEAGHRYGLEVLPAGRMRQLFQTALTEVLDWDFAGRILSFNSAAAKA
jgi:hypothetical protein